MRRIWRSGTKPNPKRKSDSGRPARSGSGRRERVTELAEPIGRLAGACRPAPVPARGEVIRRVTSSPGWSVSSTCHQDLSTSPRATAPGVQVPRLAGALGFDAGQHLGELVALEYDGLPVRGRWFGTVAE